MTIRKEIIYVSYEPEDDEERVFFKNIPATMLKRIRPFVDVFKNEVRCGFLVTGEKEIIIDGNKVVIVLVKDSKETISAKGLNSREEKLRKDLLFYLDYIRGDVNDFKCKFNDRCSTKVGFAPFLCIKCPCYKKFRQL